MSMPAEAPGPALVTAPPLMWRVERTSPPLRFARMGEICERIAAITFRWTTLHFFISSIAFRIALVAATVALFHDRWIQATIWIVVAVVSAWNVNESKGKIRRSQTS